MQTNSARDIFLLAPLIYIYICVCTPAYTYTCARVYYKYILIIDLCMLKVTQVNIICFWPLVARIVCSPNSAPPYAPPGPRRAVVPLRLGLLSFWIPLRLPFLYNHFWCSFFAVLLGNPLFILSLDTCCWIHLWIAFVVSLFMYLLLDLLFLTLFFWQYF